MSAHNTNPATTSPEARFPWRALLIGLGIALALASALRKIEAWKQQLPLATNPAMGNLYTLIAS